MKLLAKLKANAKLLENVKLVTENGRGHNVICDLSEASGGTNAGPTPLELALMGLAGCGVIIFADVCKNSKIDPGKVEVAVEAEKTSDSPTLKGVTMKVKIESKTRNLCLKVLGEELKLVAQCCSSLKSKFQLRLKLTLKQSEKIFFFFFLISRTITEVGWYPSQ